MTTAGIKDPGGRNLLLNINLPGPIAVLCVPKLVAQFSELGGVGLGGIDLARAGGANRPGKMGR